MWEKKCHILYHNPVNVIKINKESYISVQAYKLKQVHRYKTRISETEFSILFRTKTPRFQQLQFCMGSKAKAKAGTGKKKQEKYLQGHPQKTSTVIHSSHN